MLHSYVTDMAARVTPNTQIPFSLGAEAEGCPMCPVGPDSAPRGSESGPREMNNHLV